MKIPKRSSRKEKNKQKHRKFEDFKEYAKNLSNRSISHSSPLIYKPNSEISTKMKNLFATMKTLTAKEDLMSFLRRALLIHIVTCQRRKNVILGNNATNLAIKLIASTTKGRGFVLPNEISYVESIFPKGNTEVNFVQPLKEFLDREVYYYFHCKRLECVLIPPLSFTYVPTSHAVNMKTSINGLTEVFVNKLQAQFPHTVHTLLRSGDKLYIDETELQDNNSNDNKFCLLCLSLLTREERKCPTRLCYSCILLQQECEDTNQIALVTEQNVKLTSRRDDIVKEFLLDDDLSK